MTVTDSSTTPWLLLVFSLPAKSASQRVEIWRKLQRYGMLALRSSGYVLPNTPGTQERMEWLAPAVPPDRGQAPSREVPGCKALPTGEVKRVLERPQTSASTR